MKRSGIEDRVYEVHGGITRQEAEVVVNTVLQLIKETLLQGEKVKLQGFGVFQVVRRKGKTGKHPRTGKPVAVAPRQTVVFHVSRKGWGEAGDGE
jgi:nucleoid DNA-binding protein